MPEVFPITARIAADEFESSRLLSKVASLVGANPEFNPSDLASNLPARRESGFFLYVQERAGRRQTSIVAEVSLRDYAERRIRPHERTLPRKVDALARGLESSSLDFSPVFLVHRPNGKAGRFLGSLFGGCRLVSDVTDAAGIRHRILHIPEEHHTSLQEVYGHIDAFYVADGHHRLEATLRIWSKSQGRSESRILCVIASDDEIRLKSYNRVVRQVTHPVWALTRLSQAFERLGDRRSLNLNRREFAVCWKGQWSYYRSLAASDCGELTDAQFWQEKIFHSIFGIYEPSTDPRIEFVEGRDAAHGVERVVRECRSSLGFVFASPRIEEVYAVADRGQFLPPHSTWFDFKPRPGLVCREHSHPHFDVQKQTFGEALR